MTNGAAGATGPLGFIPLTGNLLATGISGPAWSGWHAPIGSMWGCTGYTGVWGPIIPQNLSDNNGNEISYSSSFCDGKFSYSIKMIGDIKCCAWLILKYLADYPNKLPGSISWGPLLFVIKNNKLETELFVPGIVDESSVSIVEQLMPIFQKLYDSKTFW